MGCSRSGGPDPPVDLWREPKGILAPPELLLHGPSPVPCSRPYASLPSPEPQMPSNNLIGTFGPSRPCRFRWVFVQVDECRCMRISRCREDPPTFGDLSCNW